MSSDGTLPVFNMINAMGLTNLGEPGEVTQLPGRTGVNASLPFRL
jgi:hypothetical protein